MYVVAVDVVYTWYVHVDVVTSASAASGARCGNRARFSTEKVFS